MSFWYLERLWFRTVAEAVYPLEPVLGVDPRNPSLLCLAFLSSDLKEGYFQAPEWKSLRNTVFR